MKKYKLVIVFILVFLFLFLFGEFFLLKNNLSKAEEIKIERGESLWQISRELKEKGVINSSFFFSLYVFLSGEDRNLKSGVYSIEPQLSISEVARKIIEGETLKLRATIIEGWDSETIAAYLEKRGIVDKNNFLALVKNPPQQILEKIYKIPGFEKSEGKIHSLEGFLFPDTYYFKKEETPERVASQMVENFFQKVSPYFSKREEDNRSGYDIVIMASLIEKEVREYDDKRLVSGILWKRLENNFPLQVDATISYLTKKKTTNISSEDLKIDSPYNTYKYLGLPPAPICNPSLDSIKASLYPENSDYWYYLSTPEGETIFSKNFQEHKKAKFKYLR